MQYEKREKRGKKKKDANKLSKKHYQRGMKEENEINKYELHEK